MRRTLYLDTSLWNRLCEQSVVPADFVTALRRNGWDLVFSPHLRYELSKTFRSVRPQAAEKATRLFSYLAKFVSLNIPCVKQVPDLLREEVRHSCQQIRALECFYKDGDYQREATEIWKLASGNIDQGTHNVLDFRGRQVSEFRAASPARTAMWRERTEQDQNVTLKQFMDFGLEEFGQRCLMRHIADLFCDVSQRDLRRISRKMLSARRYRLAQALVRGDIYIDWRCFREMAVARDTSDDCFHIENAAYCDVYATSEAGQEAYANEILLKTRVRVHDRKTPLGHWLIAYATSE
ncbi:MAG TPA: hypothetical protein VIW23_10625 [Candidatus Acidoferrum sp.]|jgi:hypothetical protein